MKDTGIANNIFPFGVGVPIVLIDARGSEKAFDQTGICIHLVEVMSLPKSIFREIQ
jgi:hypothetical protein